MSDKPLVLFTSYSPSVYGTERVLLLTAESLKADYDVCLFSPPGSFQDVIREAGIEGHGFVGKKDFARLLAAQLQGRRRVAVFTTSLWHSLAFAGLNAWFRRRASHMHFAMGGSNDRDSFSRKYLLNRFPVTIICPSDFIRAKLTDHGVRPSKIEVIPHYLTDEYASKIATKRPIATDGVRSVVVVSRVEPIKRIDVLLDALDGAPDLADLPIRVLGGGTLLEEFRERAARNNPNVTFVGFTERARQEIAAGDLMLHLCPEEPGALSVIEALAIRVPILVPDTGGTTSIIKDGANGFYFRANDPAALASKLRELRKAPAAELDRIAGNARASFEGSYSEAKVVGRFRALIEAGWAR